MIITILFFLFYFSILMYEKLHRYVFIYYYQSTNEFWGKNTPYKKANKSNNLRKYNHRIYKFYIFISPFYSKINWRDWLPPFKKYKRYNRGKTFNLRYYYIQWKYRNI